MQKSKKSYWLRGLIFTFLTLALILSIYFAFSFYKHGCTKGSSSPDFNSVSCITLMTLGPIIIGSVLVGGSLAGAISGWLYGRIKKNST